MLRNFFWLILLTAAVGCGSADDGSPTEGAPPAPEPASDEYDQYNSGGREAPGGGQ